MLLPEWSTAVFFCLVIVVHESLVCSEQLNSLLFFRKILQLPQILWFSSIFVYLNPFKRRHSTCPELMSPAHVDYIMPYNSIILLKFIFCLCKPYTVSYLILFLTHTYNSHSFCTTYLIRFKYLFYYMYFFFLSVNSNMHYLWAAQLQLLWQYKCIVCVMPIKHT